MRSNRCEDFLLKVIVSASRSPPGLSSGTFGVIFCSFGVNLAVFFGSWGLFGGAVGTFFGADGDLARQRCPKRRQPPIPLTILDPSWGPKPTKIDQKSMPRCPSCCMRFFETSCSPCSGGLIFWVRGVQVGTKIDQKSMPRCVKMRSHVDFHFLMDF